MKSSNPKKPSTIMPFQKTLSSAHILLPLFCALLFLFSHLAHSQNELPSLGNTSSSLVSIEQEKVLGQAWLRSLRRQITTYDNPIVEEYFSNLVYSLAPNSEVLDRDFSLVVVDSPALNAFAVPGSIIGINAGLFIHSRSEQEFASVIAHELAHLSQRHYARQLERQKVSTPLTLAGILASVVIAATAGSDAGLAALASTQAVSADQQLRFSRQNEQEADRLGIETLHKSGFDPRAMPLLFERMMRNSRLQGQEIPEYLSTHPLSENRISDTRNRAETYQLRHYRDSLEYHVSKNIILTDYAESKPRAISYFSSIIEKGNSQYLAASRFGLAYAKIETAPQESIEILSELIKQQPDILSFHIYLAQAHHNNKDTSLAIKQLETLTERTPDNYPLMDALANLYLENNQIKESESVYKLLSRSHPDKPRVWYGLAELHGLAGNIAQLHQARAEYFYLNNRLDEAIKQLKLARQKSKSNPQNALIDQRMDELYRIKNNPPF